MEAAPNCNIACKMLKEFIVIKQLVQTSCHIELSIGMGQRNMGCLRNLYIYMKVNKHRIANIIKIITSSSLSPSNWFLLCESMVEHRVYENMMNKK
jgi:hypothetical protein